MDARLGGISVSFFRIPSPSGGAECAKKGRIKIVECYVDDLIIKAMSYEEHLQYLEVVFGRLREHALKLNPLKCAFMVSSGKFLGFVVRHRGIEIDPDKIKAITELSPPKNLK
jgi:Reverse transcriptase (RNA-dependent DNA polymerase)